MRPLEGEAFLHSHMKDSPFLLMAFVNAKPGSGVSSEAFFISLRGSFVFASATLSSAYEES